MAQTQVVDAELIAQGDIAGSRLLLQRAADAGDAQAMLALANNYDQVRYTACLGLYPYRPGVPPQQQNYQAPLRTYAFQAQADAVCYWTSDLLFQGAAAAGYRLAEGLGGARAMIADGLFKRFPCDEVFALHNFPGSPLGQISMRTGPAMAGADFFDIHITGRGAHGAMPEYSNDPVMIGAALAQSLQTIVSRNAPALKSAVVSITKFNAGSAYNVIPETAHLAGTIRIFDDEIRKLVDKRMREICAGFAAAYGAKIDVDIRDIFSVMRNAEEQTAAMADAATELFGADKVVTDAEPKMGSEDFADMAMAAPGSYVWLGMGPGASVHNPGYVFNDEILPIGASLLARIAEKRLAAG